MVLSHGQRQTGRITRCRAETDGAFHDIPAVVNAPGATSRLEIDFFARSLSNISDVIISRYRIECGAPGVANADIPNLRPSIRSSDKWVRRWNRIGRGATGFDIDSQELTAQDT